MKKFLAALARFAQLAEGVDSDQVERNAKEALGDRQIAAFFIATAPPEGYEAERIFNAVAITEGNRLYDLVFGQNYFRFDYVSLSSLWRVYFRSSMILRETTSVPRLQLILDHRDTYTVLTVEGDEARSRELKQFSEFISKRLQKLGVM